MDSSFSSRPDGAPKASSTEELANQLREYKEESVEGKPNKPRVVYYEIRVMPTFV